MTLHEIAKLLDSPHLGAAQLTTAMRRERMAKVGMKETTWRDLNYGSRLNDRDIWDVWEILSMEGQEESIPPPVNPDATELGPAERIPKERWLKVRRRIPRASVATFEAIRDTLLRTRRRWLIRTRNRFRAMEELWTKAQPAPHSWDYVGPRGLLPLALTARTWEEYATLVAQGDVLQEATK